VPPRPFLFFWCRPARDPAGAADRVGGWFRVGAEMPVPVTIDTVGGCGRPRRGIAPHEKSETPFARPGPPAIARPGAEQRRTATTSPPRPCVFVFFFFFRVKPAAAPAPPSGVMAQPPFRGPLLPAPLKSGRKWGRRARFNVRAPDPACNSRSLWAPCSKKNVFQKGARGIPCLWEKRKAAGVSGWGRKSGPKGPLRRPAANDAIRAGTFARTSRAKKREIKEPLTPGVRANERPFCCRPISFLPPQSPANGWGPQTSPKWPSAPPRRGSARPARSRVGRDPATADELPGKVFFFFGFFFFFSRLAPSGGSRAGDFFFFFCPFPGGPVTVP